MYGPMIATVAYGPKPAGAAALLEPTRRHVPLLREEGLATERAAIACAAADGILVEVFEWSAGDIKRAHQNARVADMWAEYAAVCDYVPLKAVDETGELFAGFIPIAL
jgi:hypothetical protein